jgi:hypothetical protein
MTTAGPTLRGDPHQQRLACMPVSRAAEPLRTLVLGAQAAAEEV